MKKLFLILFILLVAITASAQAPFTVYRPATPSSSYSNSNSYSSPFTIYTPAPNSYNRPAPQPQSKTYNPTGYYQSGGEWYSMPIKVTVTSDGMFLSAYKMGNNWLSNSGAVSEVGYYDSDIVKENFNYKAQTIHKGTVYF